MTYCDVITIRNLNFLKFLCQHRIFHHKSLVHTSFRTKCMISWWSIAYFVHFPIFGEPPPLLWLWRHLVGLICLKKIVFCQFIKQIKYLNFCKKLEFKIFRTLWDIKKTISSPYRFWCIFCYFMGFPVGLWRHNCPKF